MTPSPSPSPSPLKQVEQSARYELPKMLYRMLEDCTFDEEYCEIVSWQPHGLAFKVHNRDELEKILPQWFREKYESFRCLLEQWGFLKLARGKDRGCWYHKKFYYHQSSSSRSKNSYENIDKRDFIDGMPEYLSFRDEPDLEKESTQDNRIPTQKKKRKIVNVLVKKEVKAKKAPVPNKYALALGSSRYPNANLKECRYCHKYFVSQGLPAHEISCRTAMEKKGIEKGDTKPASKKRKGLGNNHEPACRAAKTRKMENTDMDESDNSDDYDYETESEYNDSDDGSEFENTNSHRNRRRGSIMSDNNRNNHKGSVLSDDTSVDSDDTSVDSVQSGCRICGFDDDHANLLLCEGCDTEVHTYCLTPPLEKVPTGDWFCDSCKLRMGKAEEEFGSLLRNVPPEMAERFGEICFAKSAKKAHWWPALIFDPRSFLHNREVVDLARRHLGKRYLVFFFENQDAFAAIPKRWIMTWDNGVEKEYDKGKSVKKASKGRKQQFQRAMNLANEAFEGGSSDESESDDMGFNSSTNSGNEEDSLSPRIPRVIGGISNFFDSCSDFDWTQIRKKVCMEVETTSPSEYPEYQETHEKDKVLYMYMRTSGKWQVQLRIRGKIRYGGIFSNKRKASFAVNLFQEKIKAAEDAFEKGNTLAPPSVFKNRRRRKRATADYTPDNVRSSSKPDTEFGTFTDKKPMGWRSRSAAKANIKPNSNSKIDHVLHKKPPPQSTPKKAEKKLDSRELKPPPPPPPLSDQERNDLLMETPFCHYYLLPLSQL